MRDQDQLPASSGLPQEVRQRLQQAVDDFESEAADAHDMGERPDLWDEVVEVPIDDVRTVLGLMGDQENPPASSGNALTGKAQGAERVRHVKRGTEYEVLHRGVELQVALTRPFCLGHLNLPALEEGNRLAIYRGADGKLWAREEGEFDDGRFVPAPPASSGQGGR